MYSAGSFTPARYRSGVRSFRLATFTPTLTSLAFVHFTSLFTPHGNSSSFLPFHAAALCHCALRPKSPAKATLRAIKLHSMPNTIIPFHSFATLAFCCAAIISLAYISPASSPPRQLFSISSFKVVGLFHTAVFLRYQVFPSKFQKDFP